MYILLHLTVYSIVYTLIRVAYAAAIKRLPLVKANNGLHLKALVDIEADEGGVARKAGDEWLLKGPATYIPRPDVVSKVRWRLDCHG